MAIITPSSSLLQHTVNRQPWRMQHFESVLNNSFTGAVRGRVKSPPRWLTSLSCHDAFSRELTQEWESLLWSLEGRVNQLALYDIKYSAPLGTLRGAPTLSALAALYATTATLNCGAGNAGKTLRRGDKIGFGAGLSSQVVAIKADAVVDGAGLMNISFYPPLRLSYGAASVIVLDKPVALFRAVQDTQGGERRPGLDGGFGLELIESWDN